MPFSGQRDAVARCEALGAQKRLPARGVRGDFARGDVSPAAFEELAVEDTLGLASRALRRPAMLAMAMLVLGSGPVGEVSRPSC